MEPATHQLQLDLNPPKSASTAETGSCAVCGASLEGRRPHAVYCSDGCRSAARDHERAARRFDPERPPCPVCGQAMAGRREGAVYCSPVCRARAWSADQERPPEGDDTEVRDGRVQKRIHGPVPRVALTRSEAADALGISVDSFERHVQPELRVIRRGRMRLVPCSELERWATENAAFVLDEVAR